MRRSKLQAILALATLLAAPTGAALAVQVFTGFNIDQLDVRTAAYGQYGQFTVDRSAMPGASAGGFVNVLNGSGDWVVRNLPVPDAGSMDFGLTATKFDLGVADGTILASDSFHVDFSPAPIFDALDFGVLAPAPVTVNSDVLAIGGVPLTQFWDALDELSDYLSGPSTVELDTDLPFVPGIDQQKFQLGHPNEQAARNQCAPMAVANSMQFLENTTPLVVPHDHKPGLRSDAPNDADDATDPSLVGELEKRMGRNVVSRKNGSGVWPLEGKMEYIGDDEHLKNHVEIKHYYNPNLDSWIGGGQGKLGDDDIELHGVKSIAKGEVSWEAIWQELCDGEDVELDLAYVDKNGRVIGRHYVEVVGAGTIGGIPYIQHVSDHKQTDIDMMDNMGTGVVDFEWLIGDFALNSYARIDQIIVQSYVVPEPSTLAVLAIALACCPLRRR